jgi:hypothetical protein
MHQQKFPYQSGNRPTEKAREKVEERNKGPLQCWVFGETKLLRDFPHRKYDNDKFCHVKEASTINDVTKSVSRIYAVVEN